MLPKIAIPTFSLILPISKKKINYRPYLVKEDKIMMMAAQSLKTDPTELAQATKNVINACVLEKDFDISNYSIIDADFLLMNIRARSVNDKVELELTCNEMKNDIVCGTKIPVQISISELKVEDNHPDRQSKIIITSDVGIKMKPTSFNTLLTASNNETLIHNNIDIVYNSIDCIYDKEKVWYPSDFTKEEFNDWVDQLESKTLTKIVRYIEELPTLVLEKNDIICPKCGTKHSIRYDDPISFF